MVEPFVYRYDEPIPNLAFHPCHGMELNCELVLGIVQLCTVEFQKYTASTKDFDAISYTSSAASVLFHSQLRVFRGICQSVDLMVALIPPPLYMCRLIREDEA